ncbi:MAG: hypothetical protein ACPHLK_04410 [Gammaproteobacteria bacterium]|jgi:hypothetical protein
MRNQTKIAQANDFRLSLHSESLNMLTQSLFKILTHDKKHTVTDKEAANDFDDCRNEEIRSLQHLENCANATRGTEAYDQFEWLNDPNE